MGMRVGMESGCPRSTISLVIQQQQQSRQLFNDFCQTRHDDMILHNCLFHTIFSHLSNKMVAKVFFCFLINNFYVTYVTILNINYVNTIIIEVWYALLDTANNAVMLN